MSIRVELTEPQVKAVLRVLSKAYTEDRGEDLDRAEFILDSALMSYENGED